MARKFNWDKVQPKYMKSALERSATTWEKRASKAKPIPSELSPLFGKALELSAGTKNFGTVLSLQRFCMLKGHLTPKQRTLLLDLAGGPPPSPAKSLIKPRPVSESADKRVNAPKSGIILRRARAVQKGECA